MITLNKWRLRCLNRINSQYNIGEFSNIQIYSSILSGISRRVDKELDQSRSHQGHEKDRQLRRMQDYLIYMFIFIVGLIVRIEQERKPESKNVEMDVEGLLRERLGEYGKKEETDEEEES